MALAISEMVSDNTCPARAMKHRKGGKNGCYFRRLHGMLTRAVEDVHRYLFAITLTTPSLASRDADVTSKYPADRLRYDPRRWHLPQHHIRRRRAGTDQRRKRSAAPSAKE